ncbi:MAG: transcription antitermination factor NusB [Candidatus Eisenbacteria bacterium]|uniref:Transcription antitermination protein NusB n=1 Tax=Eiseniibacteriota bacterium TaxID=2212470 RepID=A0A538U1N1_UNCEI|nr:MAG: transcription antitermination factor NusB [Candidatus Eisenbacteria bacterium]
MTTSLEGRRRAREAAFRVAYQADLMDESFRDTWSRLRETIHLSDDQLQLVDDVVEILERQKDAVDGALRAAAEHWEIGRLAATDRSVLRASVAELIGRPGTPARVVLNEAIEIAKRYGSEESGRFVNGVLDRVARALRPQEL